ncbi:pantetheine-phosphate adenylyltransferase [Paremcibacter congregatus]|uniref:Phosphopantetheine adenylyltransferase n=1 Tax=Paremcibacter congregatus TaxID=2043170 RepID=A0A2G4YN99_9PROT|nr:pantetheine-phosphate adenylyltransferase [Paremcibacter congregatus]QDE29228.1 pantetheine-phosphate adenylyltransferase [Paremcibacter congregatus]
MKNRIGLYPGTFDPITLGHIDIIKRGAKLVDHLILGISTNPSKSAMFDLDERVEMVRRETAFIEKDTGVTIEVQSFSTLLMTYAEEVGATAIIRGLRAVSDFEYEFQMTAMNYKLNPDIETLFLMADPALQPIASRLVKEIARFDGDISAFVPAQVTTEVLRKLGK